MTELESNLHSHPAPMPGGVPLQFGIANGTGEGDQAFIFSAAGRNGECHDGGPSGADPYASRKKECQDYSPDTACPGCRPHPERPAESRSPVNDSVRVPEKGSKGSETPRQDASAVVGSDVGSGSSKPAASAVQTPHSLTSRPDSSDVGSQPSGSSVGGHDPAERRRYTSRWLLRHVQPYHPRFPGLVYMETLLEEQGRIIEEATRHASVLDSTLPTSGSAYPEEITEPTVDLLRL